MRDVASKHVSTYSASVCTRLSTRCGLPWDCLPVPHQGLLAQDVPAYPVAQSSGLLYTEREMGEVLSKAIYHDVFTLPWPSWQAATEAAARTSGAEAGR